MRKNRREPNQFEGYRIKTISVPGAPEISRYISVPRRTIYINMAAYPEAIITRLIQDNENMAALALSVMEK